MQLPPDKVGTCLYSMIRFLADHDVEVQDYLSIISRCYNDHVLHT